MSAPTSSPMPVGPWLRHQLWRGVCGLLGGRRVSGIPPTGPAVVVCNHSSHADTAVLLATLPPAGRPVLAAAVDYWYAVPWRRRLVSTLVNALPVRRAAPAAYAELRATAQGMVDQGCLIVVFPEGTRSRDGQVGTFRSGALRLARDLQVPLVPVGLSGTYLMLPKAGRLRPVGATVSFGTPIEGAELQAMSPQQLRERVVALRGAPRPPWPDSPLYTPLHRADDRLMLGAAFAWGFAEAVSWPVMAEMFLVFFSLPTPRRVWPQAVALTAGSICGVVAHAVLARRGYRFPAPLTTPRMRATAAAHLIESPWGMRRQLFSGIPVKVYAGAAGELGTDLAVVGAATAVARSARLLGSAAALRPVARFFHLIVRHRYGGYLMTTGTVFVAVLDRVIRRWR